MKIPDIKDFTEVVPPEDDLDGFHSWKQFGGLDLAEAYTKFCSHPEFYQEDFMFMGTAVQNNPDLGQRGPISR